MKFGIFIDYANFFGSIRNNLKLTKTEDVENEICKTINKLVSYISTPNEHYKKGVQVVKVIAYVLNDKFYGTPENTLPKHGIEVKRVYDANSSKTQEMKDINQSRLDDETLMRDAVELATSNKSDGILVVTNDADYYSLGEKLGNSGRLFWAGIYEGKKTTAGKRLKWIADTVLPLQDIAEGKDEGTPIATALDEVACVMEEKIEGPHILVYRKGQVISKHPINKNTIGIGRRSSSRFYFPQVDFTDYDDERIISRQHAVIYRVGNRVIFTVHPNCTSGTWLNKKAIRPHEQFLLKPGMLIIIGNKNGFGIEYVEGR